MTLILFEVEDRAVAVTRLEHGSNAWAWSAGAWRDAPGLIGKAFVAGRELSAQEFAQMFPKADLTLLPLTAPAKAGSMKIIQLDASRWATIDDFYDAFLPALGAPDWHGRNIDALLDSMIVGGINAVEPPFEIIIQGLGKAEPAARAVLQRIIDALSSEGVNCNFGNDDGSSIEITQYLVN